jgi:hypothetical protein
MLAEVEDESEASKVGVLDVLGEAVQLRLRDRLFVVDSSCVTVMVSLGVSELLREVEWDAVSDTLIDTLSVHEGVRVNVREPLPSVVRDMDDEAIREPVTLLDNSIDVVALMVSD